MNEFETCDECGVAREDVELVQYMEKLWDTVMLVTRFLCKDCA